MNTDNKIGDKIIAQWTDEQVRKLNEWQQSGQVHPYTCSGGNSQMCVKALGTGEGILLATLGGWRCPCGYYRQNWAYATSVEDNTTANT